MSRAGALAFAALASLAGCASVEAQSSFLRRVPLEGQTVVMTFQGHERLESTAVAMVETLTQAFTARGMRVMVFNPPPISLSENPTLDFARAQHADLVLSYQLTGGATYNVALKKMDSEGVLFSLREDRVIWRTWIKYDDPAPGPGSFGRCGHSVSNKLIATLIQDGFLRR